MERCKITEECKAVSCKKIDGAFCKTYINPAYWWDKGRCPIPTISKEAEKEFKLNPLKASKQGYKGNLNLGYKIRRYQHSKKYIESVTS